MDDRNDVDDDKLIEALKKVLDKVPESEKDAVRTKIAELRENKKHANEFQHDFTTPKHVIQDRLDALDAEISEIENSIASGTEEGEAGREKQQLIKNKKFFLEGTLKRAPECDDAPEYPPVTGLLVFHVQEVHIDPLMHCQKVVFSIDGVEFHSVKPGFSGKLNFGCRQSRFFEIVAHGDGQTVLAYVFCPVWAFVHYRGDFAACLNLLSGRIVAVIEFCQHVAIYRHRAQILKTEKFAHVLKATDEIAPTKCGVCGGAVSFLKPGFRCMACTFNVHAGCAEDILFSCKQAKEQHAAFRRGYNVPHTLEAQTSFGAAWCHHCGMRIPAGNMRCCSVCKICVHVRCATVLFPSCGLTLDQRRAICAYKPAAPASAAPLCKVTLGDFDLMQVLGQGSFGTILLARHRRHNCVVALKALSKQKLFDSGELPFIDAERRMLAWAAAEKHPFLVGLRYCFFDESRLFLGMEHLAGDLLHLKPTSHSAVRLIAAEIVLALGFLHENCIIFRDLKLENVMIGFDGHVKLADYGLCKKLKHPLDVTFTYCGTPCTTAPEVLSVDGYTKDCDWFGLGCVLYELYEGYNPFPGATTEEIASSILTKVVTYSENTPRDAQSLISALLARDPEQRLGNGEQDYLDVQKHPYFKRLNWDWVLKKKYAPEFVPPALDVQNITQRVMLSPKPERKDLDCYFNRFPNE